MLGATRDLTPRVDATQVCRNATFLCWPFLITLLSAVDELLLSHSFLFGMIFFVPPELMVVFWGCYAVEVWFVFYWATL